MKLQNRNTVGQKRKEGTDAGRDRGRAGGMQNIYQKDQAERHVNPVNSSKTGSCIKGSGNKVN